MRRLGLHGGFAKKRGQPPGTPAFVGKECKSPVCVKIVDYDKNAIVDKESKQLDELLSLKDTDTISWIDVVGLHDTNLVKSLGDGFDLHPLTQEDILNVNQRPKAEDHGEYIYIIIKALRWDEDNKHSTVEQISLILRKNMVISFRERQSDLLAPIQERLRTGKGRIRNIGADYLAYSILDAVVDGYFSVLEKLGERIEALEDEALASPSKKTQETAYQMRREGLLLRRHTWPVRGLVAALEHFESPLISDAVTSYMRDLYDHAVQVVDTTETFHELLHGVLDLYLASLSNRMNEVMKILTIIATIFIPLTFLTGIYGMNFAFMPELKWRWGYPAILCVMLVVAAGMIAYFKRKKWL